MRRVVITGLGLVTPLGCGADWVWRRLIDGKSGIRPITDFEVDDLPSRIAGQVPREGEGAFRAEEIVPPKDVREHDPFILYGIKAAHEALDDADWLPGSAYEQERTGVVIGSSIGGIQAIAQTVAALDQRGPRRVSPFFIPSVLINLASGQISIRFGLKGPNYAVVTACAAGSHAIGDAGRLIALGKADVMVAGGADASVCRLGIAGFASARALSTHFNDAPERASRPWDESRDGFVMGEGAGMIVLEELEHARARSARIYGELVGHGTSGDAYHVTSPSPDGDGGNRAMRDALDHAGMEPEDIDYINAHGTSTSLGDEIELGAAKRLFGAGVSMWSTKSATGHLLGAAGGIEAVFALLALRDQIVPPTLNLDHPSPGCDIDLVPHEARHRKVRAAMSNSFGFGGTNASLIFAAPPAH